MLHLVGSLGGRRGNGDPTVSMSLLDTRGLFGQICFPDWTFSYLPNVDWPFGRWDWPCKSCRRRKYSWSQVLIGTGHLAFSKRSNRFDSPPTGCSSRPPKGCAATVGTWRLSVGAGQVSMNGAVLGISGWTWEHGGGASYARSRYIDHGWEGANYTTLGGGEQVSANGDIAFKQRSGHVYAGSWR